MKMLLILLSLLSVNVYADKCDSKTKSDLLKSANEIKVDYDEYEMTEEVEEDGEKFTSVDRYLNISIYNLSNEFTLQISNDLNDEMMFVDSSEFKDGKYTFKNDTNYKIIKYKIEVYSNTSCDKYLIKTINYTKPMFNPNYFYEVCQSNTDVPYCSKYITNEKYIKKYGVGLNEVVDNYRNGLSFDDEEEKEKSFWEKYYLYIIIGSILGIGTITGIIVFINKKRSEL